MISDWPNENKIAKFEEEEKFIEELKEAIVGIRNLRTNMNIHPTKKSKLIFNAPKYGKMIEETSALIEKLGFANKVEVKNNREEADNNSSSILTENMEVIIPLGDLVDKEEERKRLEAEIKKLEAEVERAGKMLSNPGFTSKAPAQKVEEEKAKLAKYEEMLKATKERFMNM